MRNCRKYRRGRSIGTTPQSQTLASLHIPAGFGRIAGLLRGFLGLKHRAAFVLSALGAGAMGKLLLVAVWALGDSGRSEEVVGAAVGSTAR